MSELINSRLAKAVANLEGRTPRLQAAAARAAEAIIANALEAAEVETEDGRRAIRAKEAALARDLEDAKAILSGHNRAVEAAKGKLAEERQAEAQEAADREEKLFMTKARALASAVLEEAYDLDEHLDVVAASYRRLMQKTAAFYAHFGPRIESAERVELAYGMTADAIVNRLKLRAFLRGLPLGKFMADPTSTPLPLAAQPFRRSAAIMDLLELKRADS